MDDDKNKLPTTTVYRIIKLEHLVNDIKNEIITFAHSTTFDDVKESQKDNAFFIQCWTKEKESPMMWELYSKDKMGIMIKFDVEYFNNFDIGLGNSFKPFMFDSYWRDITYEDKNIENENIEDLKYLFYKRKGYSYEDECRWVIDLRKASWFPIIKVINNKSERYPKIVTSYSDGKYKRLVQIPFKYDYWDRIISEIIIDPRANDDYFRYAKELLTVTFREKKDIRRSNFWGNDEQIKDSNSDEITQLYYFSKGRFDLIINNLGNKNDIEALKMWLFYRHESLLPGDFNTPYLKIIIDDSKIDILLNENDMTINFYITSYLIMHVIKVMYTATVWSHNHLFYEDMYKLVEKMFTLMNDFLLYEFKIEKDITPDFINKIIKFWEKEGGQRILFYYNYWKETYLICQENIITMNTDISSLNIICPKNTQERLLSNEIYNFIKIICQSSAESIKDKETK